MPKTTKPKTTAAKATGPAVASNKSVAKKAAIAGNNTATKQAPATKRVSKSGKKARSNESVAMKTQAGPSGSARAETPAPHLPKSVQTLFELHVQHELERCDPALLVGWLSKNTEIVYQWLKTVPLNELVDKEQVMAVVERHFVDVEIPPAIAEVTNESVVRIVNAAYHQNTVLNEVLTRPQFDEFVEQLLVFSEQRKSVLSNIIDLPVYGDLISGVVYEAIVRYIYESNILTKNIPAFSSMLRIGRNVVNKTAPKLGGAVEESVRSYIADNLKFILRESKNFLGNSLTDDQLKQSAMDLWSSAENQTLGELLKSAESKDVAALVMLAYHLGLKIRKTKYFINSVEVVVDCFFAKYGEHPLAILMNDMAITPERIATEIEIFAPRIIQVFKDSGELEAMLRRRLEEFYRSDSVSAFFEANLKVL